MLSRHGFLPHPDPLKSFPSTSPLARLDELGRDLPSILEDKDARAYLRSLEIPRWPSDSVTEAELPELRLYYVRLGFIASGYVNQIGAAPGTLLPKNIAVPLYHACKLLHRPPILSYDGYALYNWKRFDQNKPIALGNIDTLQNFVHLYDEHWFILVHVEIEAIAAEVLAAIEAGATAMDRHDRATLDKALERIARSVNQQVAVLKRIPEKMDPHVYYRSFRPYIRFFENVVYEGVETDPISYRGETGAQSSIMPALVAFLKIPHVASALTDHLMDMRNFMPASHRAYLDVVSRLPDPRPLASAEPFNQALEAIAQFREVHFGWADLYIHQRVSDPRGTGGTPYRAWLQQLIDETRGHRK
ncbi:MAG: indoleamine 2,3-dioxygenase [Planctomycetes bacterium]|nr:indoleamine 2,3-dioxygenase [Planctomycetota bacterium]